MNECHHYRMLRVDAELGGPSADGPHCPDCESAVRGLLRVLRAGRELGRVEPPEEAVKAGHRRLLDRLAQRGGRGLVVFLALAGGILVGSVTSGGGAGRRIFATEAMVTAGMSTAGAVALVRANEGRLLRRDDGDGGVWSREAVLTRMRGRDIMGPCDLALASC